MTEKELGLAIHRQLHQMGSMYEGLKSISFSNSQGQFVEWVTQGAVVDLHNPSPENFRLKL